MAMHIPHSKPSLGEEEKKAVAKVLDSGMLSQGKEVAVLEEACAALVGRRFAVAVNSGTAALHLALIALEIGEETPVLAPAYACAALLQPILWQRATPQLFDTDPQFQPVLENDRGAGETAIVPHLFGGPMRFPESKYVIEDIAQSIGGPSGKKGIITIGSFYATKLLTTGEGGILLTDDPGLAQEARDRRDYDNRDDLKLRYAYKMTEFQAALGIVQLKRLPDFIAQRRSIAQRYHQAFQDLPLRLPQAPEHVYFRYVVQTPFREALAQFLAQQGIDAKRPVYRPLSHYLGGRYPGAAQSHQECLSLPLYPALTSQEVQYMIESVQEFFA